MRNWVRVSAKALLRGSGIGLALVAWAGFALAAAEPSSASPSLSPVVIRGSSETTASPPAGSDPPPVVLRGSRPSAAVPLAVPYGCPPGYPYDPSSGCIVPGYANEPYDYDDWPYWGFDGFYSGGRRHRFAFGFTRRAARRPVVHLARPAVNGFGHGFAHIGGFGHR
jgi:hypothetical protein